jgi:hypothetical protein
MTDHAKLSPSAAERWMTCPGSVVLSEGMPNKSSAFADEGTCAHALGEALLLEKEATADISMTENVLVYVHYVQGLLNFDADVCHVEQKVHVNEQVYGTADAVVWQPNAKTLNIIDFKYGAGVPVEISNNLQLKIYALATLLTFKYPAETAVATIVQPRCPHSDGPVRSMTYDVVSLLDFHADLMDAAARVVKARDQHGGSKPGAWGSKHLQPSEKGCRWCLAAPKCPALANKAQTLAKQVFAPGLPYEPKALADTLDFLPILEGWIKNTREFAYGEAEQGREVPNWKLVEKRATRKWRDEAGAIVALIGQDIHPYKDPAVISPAEAEKLLAKDQRGLLDELCQKESSGHTLVHESDKRPAVKLDAASAFSKL